MVLYVTLITFLVTLLTNKFTSIVIPTYSSFMHMPIIETRFDIFHILAFLK